MKILLPVALTAIAGPLAAEETFYYIDPVNGIDVPGGGTSNNPWRSMTYALSQPLDPLARLNLMPGVYSIATGEVFPIDLVPGINVVGDVPCGARIEHPLLPGGPPVPTFRVTYPSGGPCCCMIANLAIDSGYRAIEVTVVPGENFSFDANDLIVDAPEFLNLFVGSGGNGYAYVNSCTIDAIGTAVVAELEPGTTILSTTVDLSLNRSILRGSPSMLVEAIATRIGDSLTVEGTSSVLSFAGAGLHLIGGATSSRVENFVFYGLGAASGPSGGIVESTSPGVPKPLNDVRNSIFWNNSPDLPFYDPATYTLVTNLFEDPALVGVGGSIGGPPHFVDPAGGDFHVLPVSPVPDAGSLPLMGLLSDFDGDPRNPAQGGDGTPDIGADEFSEHYSYFHPRPAVGETATLRTLGVSGELYFAFVGPISFFPGFGAGLQLTSVYFPTPIAQGSIPASGLAEASVPIAADPALAGFPYMTQAAYFTPPFTLFYSENAFKGWICD